MTATCIDCGERRPPVTFVLVGDVERPVCERCQLLYEDDEHQAELEYLGDRDESVEGSS